MQAYSVRVSGRVQRVGYRRLVQELAQELGLAGYISNEPDGSVTILIQGDAEKVKDFLERIKSPPPPAMVKDIQLEEAKPNPNLRYFTIKYGRLADELQEGLGAMQAVFNNYLGEFRDFRQEFREFRQEFRELRQEFRDFRQEFRDFRGEFREFRQEFRDYRQEFREFKDETLKTTKETLEEVREVRRDLRAILDERLARLERDIAEIRARLGL